MNAGPSLRASYLSTDTPKNSGRFVGGQLLIPGLPLVTARCKVQHLRSFGAYPVARAASEIKEAERRASIILERSRRPTTTRPQSVSA
jgi:hypothetical protein